ncbi:MAG: potassium channel protein [Candidatus Anoxymicrobium japonicum]|uniref:Potassium channel protein n=1 Tax=Candidatus Anoxymicrobium japonicum TaxID=2013648 RepID=A0A2N3G8A3_9ACTN|nr:MAG: potassium channel protein [Candidatus Anoxymicrobium japonicum]
MIVERLGFWESLYMTVITISTVGYREMAAPSRGGQIFTIIIITCGLATVVYVTTSAVELLLEGRILEIMGRRRVLREIQELIGQYIVCGYGRVGKQIAMECQARGASVVVVEKDSAVAEAAMNDGFITIEGDATEESVLRKAGLDRASGLVTGLSSDADNLFVIMTTRILRPDVFIVGRCNSDETESKLYRAGADRAISPHNIGGRHMAALLLKPLVCDFIDVVTHGQLVELTLDDISIEPGAALAGRSLRDILVGDMKGIGILGLKRPKRDFSINPRSDTVLEEGDILIVSGAPNQLRELKKVSQSKR